MMAFIKVLLMVAFHCITLNAITLDDKSRDYEVSVIKPMDIAIIIDGSNSTILEFEKMLDFINDVPNKIEIGENKTHVAVVLFGDNSTRVVLNLTDDETKIRSFDVPFPEERTYTHLGLKNARTNVFAKSTRRNAIKIAILITDGQSNADKTYNQAVFDPKLAEEEAKKLRKIGAVIYVAYVDNKADGNMGIMTHMENMADDPSRVSKLEDFDIQNIQQEVQCPFVEICIFKDPKAFDCKAEHAHRREKQDPVCKDVESQEADTLACMAGECDEVCDAKWAWEDDYTTKCKNKAGKTVALGRKGPKPNEPIYKHCPTKKGHLCA